MKKYDLLKSFSCCNINKKKINNDELINEIKTKDSQICEEVINILNNKGEVWGFKKDKKLKAIYLFIKEKEEKEVILKLVKRIMVDEINKDTEKGLDEVLLSYLSPSIALKEISKIVFDDKEVVPRTLKIGKFNIAIGLLIYFIGTFIGIIFLKDDWLIGMEIGLLLGLLYGVITKKNNLNN